MSAEAWWLDRTARRGRPVGAGDHEWRDTVASLTMGTASLVVPLLTRKVFTGFDVTRGRHRRKVVAVAGGAAVVTAVADAVARAAEHRAAGLEPGRLPERGDEPGPGGPAGSGEVVAPSAPPTRAVGPSGGDPAPPGRPQRRRWERVARTSRRVAGNGAVATIAAAGAAAAGTWAARTSARRLFERRIGPDLGGGPLALAAAILGWDLIYYWNHRFWHESRALWAYHVVHHSSEHYNLSTALRQPVAESLTMSVPYGLLAFLGVRPELIETARGVNLIYQYWIHTEAIRSIGPLERVLNTASHHRVHHGSNRQYLDRNHGSILIIWDKLFGTFEPEDEPVVYGLTKNLDTFDPVRVATHEYVDIARDVAGADNWPDRIGYVLRGPGWAYERHRAAGTTGEHATEEATPLPA
jgi:sterol desaturase/sphingolipid hydroxylase (fatty acid hydroxylase superfamily)